MLLQKIFRWQNGIQLFRAGKTAEEVVRKVSVVIVGVFVVDTVIVDVEVDVVDLRPN